MNHIPKEDSKHGMELLDSENHFTDNRLAEFVKEVNSAGGTYHKLNLGKGLVIQGSYDMSKYLQYYCLPSNLKGKAVLDIGAASGYFSLECARRGAEVTSIDVWDPTKGPFFVELLKRVRVNVTYIQKSIYELDENFGQFDLVICGSLILHLPEPFSAIQRIRSACRGRAIISTACTPDSEANPRPLCEFVGRKASEGNYWHFWDIGAAALRGMMLAAGFSRTENENHYFLASETPKFRTFHVVMAGIL